MRIKASSLVGQEYKGFKILDWKRENKRTYIYAECPKCHKKCWTRKDSIDRNPTLSCGCYTWEKNLKDMQFGRLKAIEKTNKRTKEGSVIWKCKCNCGNPKFVYASSHELIAKKVRSCGCLAKETQHQNGERAGAIIKENYCIEGTNINNLTSNIAKNNTSGVKGVTWCKEKNKWMAQIVFKGKTYYLGRYNKKEDAIEIRKIAEKKFFGEFLEWYKTIKQKDDEDGITRKSKNV